MARSAQNKFGLVADALEKVVNLACWQQPNNTMVVVRGLGLALVVVVILPHEQLVKLLQV